VIAHQVSTPMLSPTKAITRITLRIITVAVLRGTASRPLHSSCRRLRGMITTATKLAAVASDAYKRRQQFPRRQAARTTPNTALISYRPTNVTLGVELELQLEQRRCVTSVIYHALATAMGGLMTLRETTGERGGVDWGGMGCWRSCVFGTEMWWGKIFFHSFI
jgi:hypothetical protein